MSHTGGFWTGLGIALIILAMGCCMRLERGPVVIIQHQGNAK